MLQCSILYIRGHVEVYDMAGRFLFSAETRQEALQALRAAQDALNGWDPTGGCIYYYNPARTKSAWIYSRTVVTVIGKHYFAQ